MNAISKVTSIITAIAVSSIFAAKAPVAKPAVKQQEALTVWIMPNGASPQEKLEQRLNLFTKKSALFLYFVHLSIISPRSFLAPLTPICKSIAYPCRWP